MTCEDARESFEPFDDPPDEVLEHVAQCSECTSFVADLRPALNALRELPDPPDLLSAALVEVRRTRRARRMTPLVSLAAGLAIGALAMLGWLGTQTAEDSATPQVVASISERLIALLPQSDRFAATVTVDELGWHPDVPLRTYAGSLIIEAPERFQLLLDDTTAYPTDAWTRNDLRVTIDEDRSLVEAAIGCTPQLLPGCGRRLDSASTSGRAPFDQATEVAYELAVPIQTWAGSSTSSLPANEPPTPTATGIEISAVQAAPILDTFLSHGDWREIYPADRVTVWIDQDTLAPVQISVRALDAPSREAWAASLGYGDDPRQAYLTITLTTSDILQVESIEPGPDTAGFVEALSDSDPLLGLAPYRAGTLAGSADWAIRSWSKGFAWIRVDEVTDWATLRFPGSSRPLISMSSPAYGTVYVEVDGSRLFVHAETSDWIVSTNSGVSTALDALVSLGITGIPAPSEWDAGIPVTTGTDDLDGLLVPADFRSGAAALSRDARGSVITAWLGGDEYVELTQRAGDRLPLPSGASPTGVVVRNTTARYLPELGRLEWLEAGNVFSLTIRGADLTRLARFAEDLEFS